MNKEAKDKHFIKKPVYLGGSKAMSEFIYKNLKYPESAIKEKIEGHVYIRYGIDHKGNVLDTKVISSLSPDCDSEAERVVKLLKFNVAKQYKARVIFHKNVRVWFKPKKTVPASPVNYSYSTIQKKKGAPKQAVAQKKSSYSYTITIQ